MPSAIHQARLRRAHALSGKRRRAAAGDATGAEAGLQVPGLFKMDRDQALLDRAELLNDNWNILLRETYDLGKPGSSAQKLREGFSAELGQEVIAGTAEYLRWYQIARQGKPGSLLPQFTSELEAELKTYGAVRDQVNHVLKLQGTRTTSLQADRVYNPKAEAEPVISGFQKRLLEALALAALVALGMKIFGVGLRRSKEPEVVYL